MKKAVAIIGAFALPVLAFAQTIDTILMEIGNLINILTIIVVALALLVFLWGLVKWLFGGAADKDAGRDLMIWGVIALFVMVSVWGLVRVLNNTFGIGAGGTAPIPGVLGGGFNTTGGTNVNVGVQTQNGGFWANI